MRQIVADLTATVPGIVVVDCDPELADTAAFCAAYGYELDDSANAIVVVGKAEPPTYAVCVVLATTRLDVNGIVRSRLRELNPAVKKASFASAEATTGLVGMMLGGVTPFGLPPDVPLWVDAAVIGRDRIVVGGGSRSCKVVGPPAMLLGLRAVEVIDGLARPA